MNQSRFFHVFFLLSAALTSAATVLFFQKGTYPLLSAPSSLITQNVNEYLGPGKKSTGSAETIRIQILVNDASNPQGVQIEKVTFNHKRLKLKPRDIYGFRGQGSFQLPPGTYKLKWTVQRDAHVWPRTTTHEEEVVIDPRDLWIQITITGETASIT